MQYDSYENFYPQQGDEVFEFLSVGKRGVLLKRVIFEPTANKGIYNLAMGDVDIDGELNTSFISNNGDIYKVFTTIADIVEAYLRKYPDRLIYFHGNTAQKNRLYRIAIGNNLHSLSTKFMIYSEIGNNILPFEKDMPVDSFYFKIKP
jgi:hypothetical protein